VPVSKARAPAPQTNPAAEAAALLRRIGFAILALLVPAAAMVSRRGIVVLVPIGIVLILIASALDGAHRPIGESVRRLAASAGGMAAGLVLGWCALSLLWSPVAAAGERLVNVLATLAIATVGYALLPDRMRAANLYLIPIGVLFAGGLGLALALFDPAGAREEAAQNLERGIAVLAMLAWPALAWLRSRGRDVEALGLVVVIGLVVAVGPSAAPLTAFGIGAVVYAATELKPRESMLAVGAVMAGLLALGPLVPFLLSPVAGLLPVGAAVALDAWQGVVTQDPVRLVTGHGFDSLRVRMLAGFPPGVSASVLFEVWYEFGIVGALAGAVALFEGARAAARAHPPLVPGAAATFATAFALASLEVGARQMWWFTAVTVVVLLFAATGRGQFRTTRPKAVLRALDSRRG
jgi:hypothetical protein